MVVENQENRRRIRENTTLQRQLRDHSNPFELPERTFLKLFRLNKITCQQLINDVSPHLHHSMRLTKVPVHLRVLIALNFFGQGSYQLSIGHGFCFSVSQPVVSRIISEVSDALSNILLNEWIKFPISPEAREHFQAIDDRFHNAIGIVDGTYIRIVAPPANHDIYPAPPYYCRKNYYAINTQIICDSQRRIIAINARFPGSVHDLSVIRRQMIQTYIPTEAQDYLIGDSGYPLEPWLLVPYINPRENSPQARLNSALSRIRIGIEHVNGMLKNRLRCLHGHRALHYNPVRAAKIIYSCAILHNMCLHFNVPLPNEEIVHLPPVLNQPNPPQNEYHNVGVRRRDQLLPQF